MNLGHSRVQLWQSIEGKHAISNRNVDSGNCHRLATGRVRGTNNTGKEMSDERAVIVCTEHRGVFFGYAKDTSGDVIHLRGARMAIYWGTTRGVMELAETGPTTSSKISARANIEVRKISAVFEVTAEAITKWEAAP